MEGKGCLDLGRTHRVGLLAPEEPGWGCSPELLPLLQGEASVCPLPFCHQWPFPGLSAELSSLSVQRCLSTLNAARVPRGRTLLAATAGQGRAGVCGFQQIGPGPSSPRGPSGFPSAMGLQG